MFKLNRRQAFTAGTIGIAALILGLWVFLYGPLLLKQKRLAEDLLSIQQETAMAKGLLSNFREEKGALLKRQDAASVMDEITKAGEFYTVKFLSINPKETEESPEFARLPLQVDLEAEYQNFGKFLASLEQMTSSIIVVDRFSMTTDERLLPLLKIKLQLSLYLKAGKDG